MTTYDLPDVIQIEGDGPLRVIRLNRPDDLNAANRELHAGLAALWPLKLQATRRTRPSPVRATSSRTSSTSTGGSPTSSCTTCAIGSSP